MGAPQGGLSHQLVPVLAGVCKGLRFCEGLAGPLLDVVSPFVVVFLPLRLFPSMVPCMITLARPSDLVTWPYVPFLLEYYIYIKTHKRLKMNAF